MIFSTSFALVLTKNGSTYMEEMYQLRWYVLVLHEPCAAAMSFLLWIWIWSNGDPLLPTSAVVSVVSITTCRHERFVSRELMCFWLHG